MRNLIIIFFLTFNLAQAISAQVAQITPPHPLPTGEALYWGNEPVVDITKTHSEIVLNGLWEFMPATGVYASTTSANSADWGYIRVPGLWKWSNSGWPYALEGCVITGTTGIWNGLGTMTNLSGISGAWYRRNISIPEEWINEGRQIILYTNRVCDNAYVYAGNAFCGCLIDNLGGSVDLTGQVTAGNNVLTIKVSSNTGNGGLYDDVVLKSFPQKHIDGFLVRTSVQNKTIGIDLDLDGADQAGAVSVSARVVDQNGNEVKTFTATSTIANTESQTIKIDPWSWTDPLLWDYLQPNLYTMYVTVSGQGFNDECAETFGFREFRVAGRELFLNEKPFYLRPSLYYNNGGGVIPILKKRIDALINANFNCVEMWPGDNSSNGTIAYQDKVAQVCSQEGLPLMYSILSMDKFGMGGVWYWDNQALWDNYMAALKKDWKRYRNEPSVIILSAWGNQYPGGADDCNPTIMGNSKSYNFVNGPWQLQYGKAMVSWIKQYVDDIHPIMAHNGIVGDIYSGNVYLNFTALQERENWSSQWAKSGDVSFSNIEFGTPLDMSFYRSREQSKGSNYASEPWATEFAAIYFGSKAYGLEPESYRNDIVNKYLGNMDYVQGMYSAVSVDTLSTLQELQKLFVQNTWRSWRTFGFSGGLLPWGNAHGWIQRLWNEAYLRPGLTFVPGQRGVFLKSIAPSCYYSEVDSAKILPAGKELIKAQDNILAYIGGYTGNYIGGDVLKFSDQIENFTSKDHHFYSGDAVKKSAVLVYDATFNSSYAMTWSASANGTAISGSAGGKSGTVNASDRLFIPIEFIAPTVSEKTEGEIDLTTEINGRTIEDVFPVTFYPKVSGNKTVYIADSTGETKKAIEDLGYTAVDWNGEAGAAGKTLVVGRNSSSVQQYDNFVLSSLEAAGFPTNNVTYPMGQGELALDEGSTYVNNSSTVGATVEMVDAGDGVPFKKAVKLTTNQLESVSNVIQFGYMNVDPVKKGDIMLMTFYTKGAVTGTITGTTNGGIDISPLFNGSLTNNVPFAGASEWQRVIIPIKFNADYPAGRFYFGFYAGSRGADAEIGGVSFVNIGNYAFDNTQLTSMFTVFVNIPLSQSDIPIDKITQFADEGGAVIILDQQPDLLQKEGFRVGHVVARRAFPVPTQANHSLLAGLSSEDFRDWNGAGTLIPAQDVSLYTGDNHPYWAHWGNDGSVSSAVIEKPHFSNFTPILECEFDLQYTPLMECRSGNGAIVWCTLDVTGRTVKEPVADLMLKRLLDYQPNLIPVRKTYYVGNNAADMTLLNNMNINYTQQTALPADANALAIIGRNTDASALDISGFIANGGNAFIMGQSAATKLGFSFVTNNKFHGSLVPPDWDETAGLSASDLRLKANINTSLLNTAPAKGSVGADGLLGRYADGTGKALIITLLPDQLGASQTTKSYLRFSKWRNSRTVAQCLTNLGAEFNNATSYYDADYIKDCAETWGVQWWTGQYGWLLTGDDRDDPYRNHQW